MDTYDKNIMALKEEESDIVEKLSVNHGEEPDHVKVLESDNGYKVMFIKSGGSYLQVNSMYDPYEEAEYLCRDIKKDYLRRLVVVIGVGMGYHLKALNGKLNEKSAVIVIERDINVLKAFLKHQDFSEEIGTGRFLFVCGSINEVKKDIEFLISAATFNLKDITIITLPVMDIEYIRFCKEVAVIIDRARANHIFNMGNDTEDTLVGIRNNFLNMHEMLWNCGVAEFMELYGDEYKGKPAVVVASGPSLNKNIHLLKDVQKKALILACDGSLKPLLQHGIIPDAVASVERIWLTYELFYKDKEIPADTVLIAPPIIRPEIFDRFADNRKILCFKSGEGVNEWMAKAAGHKGTIPCGSSVAHLCFNFASLVGADPIILIGQDLAYSEDGHTHGSGVEGAKKVDFTKENIVYVKDYEGNDIPSTTVWRNFLTLLEAYIRNSPSKCIDATEGGARKEGTEIMKLRDAINLYFKEELPPLHTIVEKYKGRREQVVKSYETLVGLINKEIRWFKLLRSRLEQLKKKVEDIENNSETYLKTDEGIDRIFDVVMLIEKKLAKKLEKRMMFIMMFQTPLRDIAFEISDLGSNVKVLTPEILLENIRIQTKLILITDLISKETINTLEEVLKITEDDLQKLKVGETA